MKTTPNKAEQSVKEEDGEMVREEVDVREAERAVPFEDEEMR